MERSADGEERGFVHGLAHRGMGVDRPRDVLRAHPHLDREGELSGELGSVRPCHLRADDGVARSVDDSRAKPDWVPRIPARAEALMGKREAPTSIPSARASSSDRPTLTTSGSEKTTAGTAAGSNRAGLPHTDDAATSASAKALCARAGP